MQCIKRPLSGKNIVIAALYLTAMSTLSSRPALATEELEGLWSASGTSLNVCRLLPGDCGPLDHWGALQTQIEFQGRDIRHMRIGKILNDEIWAVTISGTYLVGAAADDSSNLDIVWTTKLVAALTEDEVARFNMAQFCGHSDWQVKVLKDVTGDICNDRVQIGSGIEHFGVVRVAGDDLYLGAKEILSNDSYLRDDLFQANSPSTRVILLAPRPTFRRR